MFYFLAFVFGVAVGYCIGRLIGALVAESEHESSSPDGF